MELRSKIFAAFHGPRWTPDNFASVVLAGNPVPSESRIVSDMILELAERRVWREDRDTHLAAIQERIAMLEEKVSQFWEQFN